MACSASTGLVATTTPLPPARPSAFTTIGTPRRRTNSSAAAASLNFSHFAVGMPTASQSSLVKLLLPSSCAAAAVGPQQGMPAAVIASVTPATSGASGPGTHEVDLVVARECDERTDVQHADRHVLGTLRDARVARRAPELRQQRRAGNLPAQRVLTAARPDDQNPHGPIPSIHARSSIGSRHGRPAPDQYSQSPLEISGAVKRTLESAFGRVRVRGEITELKRYSSGHIYFSLKDEGGKLAGVIWKSAVGRLRARSRERRRGDRAGENFFLRRPLDLSTHRRPHGIRRRRRPARAHRDAARAARGRGAVRRRPQAGRAFPLLPEVIGVVTSAQGAVIQDIRTTIERRFPRRILLWPVPVQGEGAAKAICEALRGFCSLPRNGIPPPTC